jgi:hypothetical protein
MMSKGIIDPTKLNHGHLMGYSDKLGFASLLSVYGLRSLRSFFPPSIFKHIHFKTLAVRDAKCHRRYSNRWGDKSCRYTPSRIDALLPVRTIRRSAETGARPPPASRSRLLNRTTAKSIVVESQK